MKPLSGWAGLLTESAKLTASDGAEGDSFGGSVAVSGETVVVGAFRDGVGSNCCRGSAYVFMQPPGGWAGALTENAKLTASDGGERRFGSSVAVSGETVAVGTDGTEFGSSFGQARPMCS